MQNDLKYGKISEICGINGYFAGKILKKIAPAAPKKFPLRGRKFTHIFMGGGVNFDGRGVQFLMRGGRGSTQTPNLAILTKQS